MKDMNLKTILLLPVILVIISFSSCRDFLDISEYTVDMLEYDTIFKSKLHLEEYLWGAAASLPDEANIWGSTWSTGPNAFPGVSASDEAYNQWNNTSQPGTMYILGGINADNVADGFSGKTFNFWKNMYQIIRKTNMIVNNIDKTQDLGTTDRNNILGYTYFLRAYAYYHILMNQGPVIIVDDNIYEVNREAEYYNTHRATYEESVEYICNEFERAARYIPDGKPQIDQFGRPTPGAARALIARVRLQHASPLFNGTAARTYFMDWKRSVDDKPYVAASVTGEVDENRWAIAAWAAERIIDNDGYELHVILADTMKKFGETEINPQYTPELPAGITNRENYPNGPGGIDHYKSYAHMFNGEGVPYQNKEFIWARWSTSTREYTRHSFPESKGGYGGMAIPQKIIDNYRMNDGSDAPKEPTTDKITKDSLWSGYKLGVQGRVNMFYVNREPRFYASIGFQGCYWPMNSNSALTNEAAKYMDYTRSGADGATSSTKNKTDYTLTGYVSKKFIHPDDAWLGTGNKRINKAFPIIRYAEILLSYVEAMNNLEPGKVYTVTVRDGLQDKEVSIVRNEAKMLQCFNLIRYRAGLPGLESIPAREEMFKLIERERMIEFLHENRRFYDVRRWGVYESRDKEPITGMDVEQDGDAFYHVVRINNSTARNRIVDRKMVFLPISTSELRKVPGLDQNPGW